MKLLRDAIYRTLSHNTILIGYVGSKIFDGAPTGEPAMPYAVMEQQDIPPSDPSSEGDLIEEHVVRFIIYATDSDIAEMLTGAIWKQLKTWPIVLVPNTHMATMKEGESISQDPDKTSDGLDVWCATVSIKFTVQTT
jgi:hypothetical protein